MFTFLHSIFVYGYQGKSTSASRSRTQKAHNEKVTKQTRVLFSSLHRRRADQAVFVGSRMFDIQLRNGLKQSQLFKVSSRTSEESRSLKMLQEILKVNANTKEQQKDICKISDDFNDSSRSFVYGGHIQDSNERLYFTLLTQYIDRYLPIVKTSPVVTSCKDFGHIYQKPKGLFININNRGQVYNLLQEWPENNIRAIIVTESGRILGQDDPTDQSAFGRGIPLSKLALYTALAGIKPNQCLPITLDVGTDNLSLLEDPTYIGLKQRRVRGNEYDEFINELMDACVQRFGPNTLVLKTAP